MTTTYNITVDKDKDFQKLLEEGFIDISEQIKSIQKAANHHKQGFNHKLPLFESLSSPNYAETKRLPQYHYEGCLMRSVYDITKITMLWFGVKNLEGEF